MYANPRCIGIQPVTKGKVDYVAIDFAFGG